MHPSASSPVLAVSPAPITQQALRCPLCQPAEMERFFALRDVPTCAEILWGTAQDARLCPRGNIELMLCRSCGLIANAEFELSLVDYDSRYESSLHFSPLFQEYAEQLARRLVHDYELHGKTIIEIGCGKAEFLALLCRLGENRGIGFDPSYVHGRVDSAVGKGISVICDQFSEKYCALACDLLCCRHTLEHIPEPVPFLRQIRRALGHQQVPVFFEVPSALFTLRHVWDVIFEHCFYFNSLSLSRIFQQCQFVVGAINEVFGGQFLGIDAMSADGPQIQDAVAQQVEGGVTEVLRAAQDFGRRFLERVEYWRRTLQVLQQSGKRVVPWGAGAKAVTFLNAIKMQGISYIVDVNAHKHGRYIPGTAQEVVSPAFLQEYRPDVVLVFNPLYCNEIEGQLRSMGLTTEVTLV